MVFIKRHGNLYEKIYEIDNLREAHRMARKGKSHYTDVQMVDYDPDLFLAEIYQDLKDETYLTANYRVKTIVDRGKTREIYVLPYYPDRIVQWAIMLQIEPILLNTFILDTYGSIPNRGIHFGVERVRNALKDVDGTKYALQIDVKKFFPSIDNEILKEMLRWKFKDEKLLRLLDGIIDTADGVPIGNYISQYFGNYYLSWFDHYMKEQCGAKYYFRYMDDIVILHHDKAFLHELYHTKIEPYMNEKLNLTIKENRQIYEVDLRGVDFIGYRFFHDYTLLRKKTYRNIRKKCNYLMRKHKLSYSDRCTVESYKGWIKWANCHNLYTKYIEPLERRLQHEGTIYG